MTEEKDIDRVSATRFISSLSKSLQALCHGCINFEKSIKITGYINVEIDESGLIDYVLNEKVGKREDNAMTFVSKSFLAKKDEPKLLKDGSCSPIKELTGQNYYQPYSSYQNHSDQHSYVGFRSPIKRSWAGSDSNRIPRKYSRGRGRGSFLSNSSPSQSTQGINQQSSQLMVDGGGGQQSFSHTNVKSEAPSSDNSLPVSGSLSDPASLADSCYFKQEPGTSTELSVQESDSSLSNTTEHFLEDPSSSSYPKQDNCHRSRDNSSDSQLSNTNTKNSEVSQFSGHDDEFRNQPQTSSTATFDEEGDNDDEESFEVIEIGDDNEDMQAMFGNNRKYYCCQNSLKNIHLKTFLT